MKRRSFFATVIGGACAAVWTWKVEAEDTDAEPWQPYPLLCFQHGGSPKAWEHNDKYGFVCPRCVDPEPPGTIKLWLPNDVFLEPPDGWAYADGVANSKRNFGSGEDIEDIIQRQCKSIQETCRDDLHLEWKEDYRALRFIERLDDRRKV